MSNKTLVNGTAYEIIGGKTLVGYTEYNISNGKTLVGGTGYDISFGVKWAKFSCDKNAIYEYSNPQKQSTAIYHTLSLSRTEKFYPSYIFTSTGGFTASGTVLVAYGDNASIANKYQPYGRGGYMTHFLSIFTTNGDNVVWEAEYYYCTRTEISATYSKGSTFYDYVQTSGEDEIPEGGTIVDGSVESGICVVDVNGTIYWYERV